MFLVIPYKFKENLFYIVHIRKFYWNVTYEDPILLINSDIFSISSFTCNVPNHVFL